jgi:hypothetical protein
MSHKVNPPTGNPVIIDLETGFNAWSTMAVSPAGRAWRGRSFSAATSLLRDRTRGEGVVRGSYACLLEKAETYDLQSYGAKRLYKVITHACIDRNYRDRRLLSVEVGRDQLPESLTLFDFADLSRSRASDRRQVGRRKSPSPPPKKP